MKTISWVVYRSGQRVFLFFKVSKIMNFDASPYPDSMPRIVNIKLITITSVSEVD